MKLERRGMLRAEVCCAIVSARVLVAVFVVGSGAALGSPADGPPFAEVPSFGLGQLALTSATGVGDGDDVAFGRLLAAAGLPLGRSALRVGLPFVSAGDARGVGSATVDLATMLRLRLSRSFELDLVSNLGVAFGSGFANPIAVGDIPVASPETGLRGAYQVRVLYDRRAWLALRDAISPDFNRASAEAGLALAGGQLALGVGASVSILDDADPVLSASVTYRPRWLPELSATLFASRADRPMAGLSLTWDFAWNSDAGPAGRRLLLAPAEARAGVAPLDLAPGRDSLDEYAVRGEVTVFAFEAWWCTPCRDVERELDRLASLHEDLLVRTIDVDRHASVLQRAGGVGVPFVVVYDREARLVGSVSGVRPRDLEAFVSAALRARAGAGDLARALPAPRRKMRRAAGGGRTGGGARRVRIERRLGYT